MDRGFLIVGVGLGAVAVLQIFTLQKLARLQTTMDSMQKQQSDLETAVEGLTTEIGVVITDFQNVSAQLQQAQAQLSAEGSAVDLSPQIQAVTALTQRLSAAMPDNTVTPVTPAPVTTNDAPGPGPANPGSGSATLDTQALWADSPIKAAMAGGSASATVSIPSPQASDTVIPVTYTGAISGPSSVTIPAGSTSTSLSVSYSAAPAGTNAGDSAGSVAVGSGTPTQALWGD